VRKPRGAKSAWLGTNEPAFLSHEDPTTHGGVHRARGLSGITPGHGPTTGMLFALGADSQVHVYHAATLQPLSGTRMGLAHPGLKGTSFYARTALSPCGRWLATGSAGLGGNAFMFDVGGLGSMLAQGQDVRASVHAVHLQGHVGEVGAPDWADGGLATCADDGTVRMWRPDVEVYRRCQAEPQEAQWDWSWAKAEES
jgi:denticleless